MHYEDFEDKFYEDLIVQFLDEKDRTDDFWDYCEDCANGSWQDLFEGFLVEWNLKYYFDEFLLEEHASYMDAKKDHQMSAEMQKTS